MSPGPVAIIGAGPAGLTAAYLLTKADVPVAVFEGDPQYVGGISKTALTRDFTSTSADIASSRSRRRSRTSGPRSCRTTCSCGRAPRASSTGMFFAYPLKARRSAPEAGHRSNRCAACCRTSRRGCSRCRSRAASRSGSPTSSGSRLFQIFFKTYTEKVWGMGCKEISADWAAQRIKGLSLTTAVLACTLPKAEPRAGRGGGEDADRLVPLSRGWARA